MSRDDRYRLIEEPGQREFVRSEMNRFLVEATERGCESIGCTGISFVLMGVGSWFRELCEIDPAVTAQYFRTLAVIADPKASESTKQKAEARRTRLFKALCGAAGRQIENQNDGDAQ